MGLKVIDSIVWAFRHKERNVADMGLNLLLEMLTSFDSSEAATAFYQTYYMQLVTEIFAVMTDTFHKPGFKMHARILHHLFMVLSRDVIRGPLWPAGQPAAFPNNTAFVHAQVSSLLTTSFPNMRPPQIEACVTGMFTTIEFSAFKQHLRDFLVQTKAFADSGDNAALFAEETAAQQELQRQQMAKIPGMLNPNEVKEEAMGD